MKKEVYLEPNWSAGEEVPPDAQRLRLQPWGRGKEADVGGGDY